MPRTAANPTFGGSYEGRAVKVQLGARVLYVQFGDPNLYPPIENSAHLLAARGWDILKLGTREVLDREPPLPTCSRIQIKQMRRAREGWWLKVQYLMFLLWALYWAWWWKPRWLYASDPLSCPVAWIIEKLTKVRVLYHEHDLPGPPQALTWFMKQILVYRQRLAKSADICVLPQQARLQRFLEGTQRRGQSFCVWNCPRLTEIPECVTCSDPELVLYFHGSISSDLLPIPLILAAGRFNGAIRLRVVGYEVPGSIGYMRHLANLAAENGVPGLIEPLGFVARRDLLQIAARKGHVGIALMPKASNNINHRHMVGASNKAFDYMASGLPLLVTDLPDWIMTFVELGFGQACDPEDADLIEGALRWYLDHSQERREMGRKGKTKIREAWNYEMMFAGVLEEMENDAR